MKSIAAIFSCLVFAAAAALSDSAQPIVLSRGLAAPVVQKQGFAVVQIDPVESFVVAQTNHRPFGFDGESFGRLDAVEVMELAQKQLDHGPRAIRLSGHSMGGDGTWHLGATSPGRFAAFGPSDGWISLYSHESTLAITQASRRCRNCSPGLDGYRVRCGLRCEGRPGSQCDSLRQCGNQRDVAMVASNSGTSIEALRLSDRLTALHSRAGYSDWMIVSTKMLGPDGGTKPVRGAGFFGNDWSLQCGESLWQV